jgi:hypothetical protein
VRSKGAAAAWAAEKLRSPEGCQDSAWALDAGLSGGLVNRQRSDLFRLAERLLATKQAATTTTDQVLSAAEQAQFRATLAAAGNSDSDLSYHQGQWRLGSAPASGDSAAGGSASRDTTEPVRKIETELRTLWVSPYTLRIRFTSLHGVRRRRLNSRFSSPTPPPGSRTPPRQKLRHPGA